MLNKMHETNRKGETWKVYKILTGKDEDETALGTTLHHCQNYL
jgi:hypothetical protein